MNNSGYPINRLTTEGSFAPLTRTLALRARLGFASASEPRLRHAGKVGGYSKVLHGSCLASRVASRGMAKVGCAISRSTKEWGDGLPAYLGGTPWQH
jgi:hypothetical protein